MIDIQRYEPRPQEWPMEDANGDLVLYEDHVKVVQALETNLEELDRVLRSVIKYIPSDVVECRGDKCREPWCASCFGWDAAEQGAEKAREDLRQVALVFKKIRDQREETK